MADTDTDTVARNTDPVLDGVGVEVELLADEVERVGEWVAR